MEKVNKDAYITLKMELKKGKSLLQGHHYTLTPKRITSPIEFDIQRQNKLTIVNFILSREKQSIVLIQLQI